MTNKYPLKGIADLLASRGRNGDTMIVHMNPVEVAGIAALSPKGLTINPDTGQVEAFNWMESVLPMAAGIALTAVSGGTLAAPVAMALGSGITSTAMTGDIRRGLITGAMGAAGGAAMGSAAANAAAAGATDAAAAGATDALAAGATDALATGVGDAATSTLAEGMAQQAGQEVATELTEQQIAELMAQRAAEQSALGQAGSNVLGAGPDLSALGTGNASVAASPIQATAPAATENTGIAALVKGNEGAYAEMSPGERMAAPFQKDSNLTGELMKPSRLMPIAAGGNYLAQMDAAEANGYSEKEIQKKRDADRRGAIDDLQRGYAAAQPNAPRGVSPYRRDMSYRTPVGYAQGGAVGNSGRGDMMSMGPRDKGTPTPVLRKEYGYATGGKVKTRTATYTKPIDAGGSNPSPNDYTYYPIGPFGKISTYGGSNPGYVGIDPVTIQAGLRGIDKVNPSADFRPGIDPEFDYFQNDPENVYQAPATVPRPYPELQRMQQPSSPYFESFIPQPEAPPAEEAPKRTKTKGMAGGGMISVESPVGDVEYPDGGIADLPLGNEELAQSQQSGEFASLQEDLQVLALALLGKAGKQTDAIIKTFVEKYGKDAFMEAKSMIMNMDNPEAQGMQTEGLVSGAGGGMDDQIGGTIEGQQPVALSSGEYIVPADVVSGLGDGSSEAGSRELDQMSQKVRMARGGTVQQPQPFDARRVLPR
jgi:hypothetical protein